jgi:hypothetical protein
MTKIILSKLIVLNAVLLVSGNLQASPASQITNIFKNAFVNEDHVSFECEGVNTPDNDFTVTYRPQDFSQGVEFYSALRNNLKSFLLWGSQEGRRISASDSDKNLIGSVSFSSGYRTRIMAEDAGSYKGRLDYQLRLHPRVKYDPKKFIMIIPGFPGSTSNFGGTETTFLVNCQ